MSSQNRIGILAAAVWLALPMCAAAQDQHPTAGESSSQWIASGFAGSNFANDAKPASTNVGGSLAYLWKRQWGAELDLGFTPTFKLQNNFFGLGVEPAVNSYMANAVWAKAFGSDGQWRPFVSGGIGALQLRSGITSVPAFSDVFEPNDSRFGGNIGGGFMGFSGNWGFKADVRYFRATGTYNVPTTTTTTPSTNPNPGPTPNPGNPTPTPGPYGLTTGSVVGANASAPTPMPMNMGTNEAIQSPASAALTGLHYWRANVGVAFRWPR